MGVRRAAHTARTRDGRVRVLLALACAMLVGVTLFAPTLARAGSQHAHHRSTVKVVALASADQGAAGVRFDQPVAALAAPLRTTLSIQRTEQRGASVGGDQSSVEAVQARGPPGGR